jgi:hypothetical protein
MSDDPPVTALVARAQTATSRHGTPWSNSTPPLLWSICRRYQLGTTRCAGGR